MNIKKASKTNLSMESTSENVDLSMMFYKGTITLKLKSESRDIEITKPGDYEYGNVNVTAFEVKNDLYESKINVLRASLESLRVVVVFTPNEIDKDILNNIANIDILVTTYYSLDSLKKVISDFDPKALILLENFEDSIEFTPEDIKKSLGITSLEEANQFKFKSTDFASDSEEFVLATYILK